MVQVMKVSFSRDKSEDEMKPLKRANTMTLKTMTARILLLRHNN